MVSSVQILPPKTTMQFALRARNGEGVSSDGGRFVEFPQNSNVVCVMFPNDLVPSGHVSRNPERSRELQRIISARQNSAALKTAGGEE